MSSDGPVKNQGFSVFNTVGAAGVTNQVPTFPRWLSLLPHGQELLRADARAGGHRRCTDCLLPTVPWSMMGRSIGPRSCVGHWGLFFWDQIWQWDWMGHIWPYVIFGGGRSCNTFGKSCVGDDWMVIFSGRPSDFLERKYHPGCAFRRWGNVARRLQVALWDFCGLRYDWGKGLWLVGKW